jgi:hypothetical protein
MALPQNLIKHRLKMYWKSVKLIIKIMKLLKENEPYKSIINLTEFIKEKNKIFSINVSLPLTAYCKPMHHYFPASIIK